MDQRGQAAVELALVLPLLAALALGLLQVALVVRDQVLVTHAAREGARHAAVTADRGEVVAAVEGASSGLDPRRIEVSIRGRGEPGSHVTVTVRYAAPTSVPVVGALVGDVDLRAEVTMRVEGDG